MSLYRYVGAGDSLTFLAVAAVLLGVAGVPCGSPSFRAVRVELVRAIRAD